ncbi:glutamate carboxypeptidase [Rhodoligotrophos appendicifer]|uniref:M20/M25/M40 family metallo-hydrolase n=1 Tax=Rhodoligotrophos appendicifer TaxID=987056 RepID=UPI0011858101|nr:M20/M25/M40 family metallo-hydrolase [Rhodoligotrophos appendicifer]
MDFRALPFDTETMLAGLRPWIECESPTWDASAVNRMMDLASKDLAEAGAELTRFPGRQGFGDCVRAAFPSRSDAPGVLIMGHMDTVHPIGTLQQLPWRREEEKCFGPGILDMKGGNFIALEAVRQLRRAGLDTPLPVTILLTSDEEVGSPSTRELIEQEASKHKFVLVPEPGMADGGVVSGRYAIARYNLEAVGKPSHAGARLAEGRSAIREMAKQILAIGDMTTEDCTFSVGVVHGGKWVNCVPTVCTGEVLSMAKRQSHLDAGVAKIMGLSGRHDGVDFTVTRGVTRPVWEPAPNTVELLEIARGVGRSLGVELSDRSVGGGSDGNFTGSMGIATLDGLGCMGDGYHTLEEYITISSLTLRAKLLAGLLMELR